MMMRPDKVAQSLGLLILGILLLSACASSRPTQFYTLSEHVPESKPAEDKPIRLGVGPVFLPAYLDRPQMVTRNGDNQMTVADFDQWVEPLETTFQRVLTENMSNQLATNHIMSLPAGRENSLDYQVEVEVIRFDADEVGKAVLDARWRIFDGPGALLQESSRTLAHKQATKAKDYASIAEAMSHCLGTLSAEIAAALRAL